MILKKSFTLYQEDGNLTRVVFLIFYYFEFCFSFLLYFIPLSGILLWLLKFKIITPSSQIHEYIYAQLSFLYIKMGPVVYLSRVIADLFLRMLLHYNKKDYNMYQHLTPVQQEQFRTFLKLEEKKIKKLQSKLKLNEQKIQSRIHNNPMLSKSTIL